MPGCTLETEDVLAARLGAGRGVVREAIRMLAAKGMVVARPRSGTRVRPRDEWSLLDREVLGWLTAENPDPALLDALAEMRAVIEPQAAAFAAVRADDKARRRIDAALSGMLDLARDAPQRAASDVDFHLAILDATGNPVLRSLHGALRAVLEAVFDMAMGYPDWVMGNWEAHRAVGEAIATRDPDAARAAMERLLEFTRTRLAGQGTGAAAQEEERRRQS
jgi:GntR family galactonate operon transcriptional repressor